MPKGVRRYLLARPSQGMDYLSLGAGNERPDDLIGALDSIGPLNSRANLLSRIRQKKETSNIPNTPRMRLPPIYGAVGPGSGRKGLNVTASSPANEMKPGKWSVEYTMPWNSTYVMGWMCTSLVLFNGYLNNV